MKYVPMLTTIIAGAALGAVSPWQIYEWQYWAFIAPLCAAVGALCAVAGDHLANRSN